jgi:hypothetical protein
MANQLASTAGFVSGHCFAGAARRVFGPANAPATSLAGIPPYLGNPEGGKPGGKTTRR